MRKGCLQIKVLQAHEEASGPLAFHVLRLAKVQNTHGMTTFKADSASFLSPVMATMCLICSNTTNNRDPELVTRRT